MPPRIQRFRIRLMRYQFTVKYVPGKYLATADTLSSDPESSSTSEEDSTEIFVSLVVAALPSTLAVRLEDFRSHQTSDEFLVVVDYRSRYPEVLTLRSTSAGTVISAIKSTFARHGIPVTVVSDNGPQFFCKAFEDFAKTYGFKHVTSSPRYPQSNGEAERMVRTIKELFLKATDPFLALLAYRNTPGVSGYSPAQLLMGRSLRTRVPATAQSLLPDWPQVKEFNDGDAAQRRRQQRDYNNRHAAHALRALDDGEEVWVRDTWARATVLSPAQRPRSYIIQTPSGILVRNRRHLVPCSSPQSAPSDET
ncbi:uncharacterized protein LOC119161872 [Rhipicephalus microplus]|uniref:uncharacterized protein LOC119161872 n=1 Tax=Rhipicephalus microplus TaxID=6941 RepID=UPI003F6CA1BC